MKLTMFRLAYPLLMMFGPRLIPVAIKYVRLIWRLTFDKRVNIILRALVPLALVYFIWPGRPFDLVPDNFPVVGRFDDLIVFGAAVLLLVKLAPQRVVDEHLGNPPKSDRPEDQDPSNVVDGSARFMDDEN